MNTVFSRKRTQRTQRGNGSVVAAASGAPDPSGGAVGRATEGASGAPPPGTAAATNCISFRNLLPSAGAGFTLLEMMITLAIFILLVAAVFTLMTGTLESANTLTDNENRKDSTVALNAFLKKRLGTLPVDSTIVSYQRGDGEGLVQNGVLFGTSYFATAFDAGVQPNGYYTLRLTTFSTGASSATDGAAVDARQSLLQSVTTNDPTLIWTSLMTDIKTIDWKFLDFNQTQWVEIWSSGTKPNLAEFTMQPAGDLAVTTMDFWLPKIDRMVTGSQQQGANGGRGGRTQRLQPQEPRPPGAPQPGAPTPQ